MPMSDRRRCTCLLNWGDPENKKKTYKINCCDLRSRGCTCNSTQKSTLPMFASATVTWERAICWPKAVRCDIGKAIF